MGYYALVRTTPMCACLLLRFLLASKVYFGVFVRYCVVRAIVNCRGGDRHTLMISSINIDAMSTDNSVVCCCCTRPHSTDTAKC